MSDGSTAAVEHRLSVKRSARIYTLGAVGAADAWIVLHGYGQLAGRFIGHFSAIAGPQRSIVAPEALNRFYLDPPRPGGPSAEERRVGTTWMTREDRDAEIADYVAYLDSVRRSIVPDAQRVTLLGFSQSVATACRWFALGTTPLERLILWAGAVPPDLDLGLLGQRTDGSPLDIVLGTRDKFGTRVMEEGLGRLREAGVQYRLIRFDGGHTIDSDVLARLAASA
ncbi:MAG: alpha/beta hydrolase [Gemmatimonadaceae bacterium]